MANLGDKIELIAFSKTLATYSGWSKKLSSLRCGYPHYEWWPEKGWFMASSRGYNTRQIPLMRPQYASTRLIYGLPERFHNPVQARWAETLCGVVSKRSHNLRMYQISSLGVIKPSQKVAEFYFILQMPLSKGLSINLASFVHICSICIFLVTKV